MTKQEAIITIEKLRFERSIMEAYVQMSPFNIWSTPDTIRSIIKTDDRIKSICDEYGIELPDYLQGKR
jgi:hypothetical protein